MYKILILALLITILDVLLFFMFRVMVFFDEMSFYEILIQEYNHYKYTTILHQRVYSAIVLAPLVETFIYYQAFSI